MARIVLYLELSRRLENLLCSSPVGDALPPERELAERFAVSKPTLRRALRKLEEQGLIRTENGVGNIVLAHPGALKRELLFLCADLEFFAETLKVFSIESANRGYISSIVPLCGDPVMRERIFRTAVARRPAGMILYAGTRSPVSFSVPPGTAAAAADPPSAGTLRRTAVHGIGEGRFRHGFHTEVIKAALVGHQAAGDLA